MAKTARLKNTIDFYLGHVRRDVEALPEIEASWQATDLPAGVTLDDLEADRICFRIEWPDLMDRLEAYLHQPYQAAQMTAAQAGQYEALLAFISTMLPVIQRMELTLPTTPVLEEIRRREGTGQIHPVGDATPAAPTP